MPLQPLKLRPGINRDTTNYGNEGGYYACDKVRFRKGLPEKIGGWVKYHNNPFVGTARNLFNWVTVNNKNLLAVGTNIKYYIESSGGLYDITPLRSSVTLGANPIAAVSGSAVLTVTHTNHGGFTGDYVTLSGAATFASIPAAEINAEHQITRVNANSYTVTVTTLAGSTASGGGAAVVAGYQLTPGANYSVPGLGWNAGAWGRGFWNAEATVATFSSLRLWSQEAFGEDHVFCVRDSAIYYWAYASGLATRAVALTTISGASDIPLMATCLLMSTADRHLIAFGTNAIGDTDQDPLLIRWCDTEDLSNWTPAITNASGDLRVPTGNHIVTAVRLKQEIIVITDGSVVGMQYIGAPDIFGLTPVAENTSIMAPGAVAVSGNTAFWMGKDKFYNYNGRVDTLPCTLESYIFSDFNYTQAEQVHAGTNEGFSEIWWFYCSASSTTIDRYVIYNYLEKTWTPGTMPRTAWLDSPMKRAPIAANGSYLYYQETGVDDDYTTPIASYVESSDIDIAEGDDFMFVTRLMPDIEFTGSTAASPSVVMTLTPRRTPGSNYQTGDASGVERTATVPIDQFTEVCDVRLRGRQLKFRVESSGLGVHWKLGVPRIDVKQDGKK